MEVKPSYKQTEVGVIPKDWEISELGNHATFKTGPFGSLLHKSDYVNGGVPVVNPMQIIDGKIIPTPSMAISAVAAKHMAAFQLSQGDVVIGRRGDMGRCAFVTAREAGWLCGTGSMIVSCRPNVSGEFLQRILSSPPIVAAIENASVGTTMVNLNNRTLSNLKIPLPPTKAEQEAIARSLGDADALIEAMEQLVAKKRQIKHGAMQNLLTGHKRLPGFSGKWDVSFVGHEYEIKLGKMLDAEKNVGVPKPYIGNRAVQWDRIDLSELPTVPMSRADIERFRLKKGDLLVCEGGEVGRAAIWDEPIAECYYQKALHRLRPLRGFNSRFMAALLRLWADRGLFSNYVTQTSIAHLPREKFMEMPLPLPPANEQSAIAAILSDMDAEIAGLEAKLAKARLVKAGMMQELLTGRIRLR